MTVSAPKIALLDVDGVSGDLIGHTLASLLPWHPVETLPTLEALVGCHDLFVKDKTVLTPEQLKHALEVLSAPKFARKLPIIAGSQEGVRRFRAAGILPVWLTAPWLSSPTWDYDRRVWLEQNFESLKTEVIMGQMKELVWGDLFIDDKPENLQKWAERHPSGRALLFDQIWNRDADPKLERFTWADTDRIIKEVLNA